MSRQTTKQHILKRYVLCTSSTLVVATYLRPLTSTQACLDEKPVCQCMRALGHQTVDTAFTIQFNKQGSILSVCCHPPSNPMCGFRDNPTSWLKEAKEETIPVPQVLSAGHKRRKSLQKSIVPFSGIARNFVLRAQIVNS